MKRDPGEPPDSCENSHPQVSRADYSNSRLSVGEDRSGESGIIVFGGGGRGCSTRGCLFWIVVSVVLSVGLTILINLILLLFSGGGSGVNI